MKRFSAQYIITNSGPPLKRGVINTHDDGTIISVENTSGNLKEEHSIEFHNGIIIPGFVNCHCHLELSHMKGSISHGEGLGKFIEKIRSTRDKGIKDLHRSAEAADKEMYNAGTVLCADVCNTSDTFNIKKKSGISYINLLEVFGIDPDRAAIRMGEIMKVASVASKMDLPYSLVPHAVYSMSVTLLRLLREKTRRNKVTSMHFMETEGERTFLETGSGPLLTSYERSGLIPQRIEKVTSHSHAILNEITLSGNLILVHNTFADRETIRVIRKRENLFWCLCPNSNLYIENKMPPVNLMLEEDCEIVIGTDSLASNTSLNILSELITLQINFPSIPIDDLILWGTLNGAKALGRDDCYGRIEAEKKPGLLLLQNVDLVNMKLLPDSFVTRLV